MPSATADPRERVEKLRADIEGDPESIATHRSELMDYLLESDPHVRGLAAQAFVLASGSFPFTVRPCVDRLLTRLDDTDRAVRINIQITISHLAQLYPQDFAAGTELLVDSLQVDDDHERRASASALAEIARQRPDVVSPRQQALDELTVIRDELDETDGPRDTPTVDPEALREAIAALEGGDMASRPVESDLAPVGRRVSLSRVARAGIVGFLWMPLAIIWILIGVVSLARVVLSKGSAQQPRHSQIRAITHLKSLPQVVLAARRSRFPTPSILPGFPGTQIVERDPTLETPDKPANWDMICQVVYDRDGAICRNCGVHIPTRPFVDAYIDFQQPHEHGGAPLPKNLRTLCGGCFDARTGGQ